MDKFWRMAAAAALLTLAATGAQADVLWRFTTGLDLSTGKYGDTKITDVWDVPFTVKALVDNWTFSATAHYLEISGPANIAFLDPGQGGPSGAGNGGSAGGAPGVVNRSRNGFGDTTLAAAYTFRDIDQSPVYAELTGKLRLPTGNDHEGLGVGATDEIANVEVGGNWKDYGVYVSGGRRFLGDSPLFQRRDGWQASAGGWYDFAPGWEAGSYYYWQSSEFVNFAGARELGAYVSARVASEWRLQLLASKGFSEASPDWYGGLTITWRPTSVF
jgi:hypothetical protein